MNKLNLAIVLLFLSTLVSLAQEAPLLDWAKNIGATLYNGGNGIATDASGNVYTTGNFFGTQDFDPGPGVFNMSVTGSDDGIFISKLNSIGDFVWAKSITNIYNTADAIAVDNAGNIIITGFFDKGDVMDFDPGPGTFNLTAVGYDMFVLKLTANGDFLWVKHIKGAGTAAHAFPESIALDASGNIYTTGYFQTTIDFDPGAGTFNLTAGEFRDIFISKLDTDGNFVWAKAMLGAGTCGVCDDKPRSIALDASGNVYTSGFLRGTADFDPGPGSFNLTPATGGGFFISKLDNNGDFIWAKTMGSTASGVADVGDMALDASGNIFTTGGVYGTSDFDPGPGTFTLTSAGSSDIFICKLNATGDFVWAKLFGVGGGDFASTIDTDGSGNVYTAGSFNGTVDFDPGAGTFNLSGGSDYFLQKLDTDGNFYWAYSMNSGGSEASIKVQSPNVYVMGQLQAATTADLDPGPCSLISNPGAVITKKIRLGSPLPAPTISSFTPTIGLIGTSVTITGTNFSNVPAENVVRFFNNRIATVTASTSTSITAVVPASTITGVISVTTNCLTGTSATNFTVGIPPKPTITSFTPASGSVGTTVTITGTNFSTTPANNIVYFGATQASVSTATTTQLTVTVPPGATHQPISVQTNGLTAHALSPFVVTFAGGGSFTNCSFEPKVNFETNDGLSSEAFFGDIDGDGKVDVITTKRNANSISLYRNTSIPGQITSSSFAPKIDFITGTNGSANPGPVAISFGDIDGDGKPDIAVANYRGGTLAVFRNLSTPGTVSLSPRVEFAIGDFATGASLRDIDGDGKLDAVVTSFFDGVSVLRNTATSGILNASSFATRLNFATGPNPFHPSLEDFDRDGKLDIAVPNANNYTFSLLRNTSTSGTVSFAPQQVVTYASGTPVIGTGTYPLSAGDLDADGKIDLVVCNNTLSIAPIFRNTSTPGTIAFAPQVNLTTSAPPAFASIGDLDGDGIVDLSIFSGLSNPILIYKNANVPGAISISLFGSPVGFGADPLVGVFGSADIDGDGKNDIVNQSNGFYVLRNVIGEISPPTITSFTPSSGPVGTTVTITGSNFSSPFTNTVEFNGVPATITAPTATSLTVTVPAGATTGPINLTIGCNTVSSSTNFTVGTTTITITQQPTDITVCTGNGATFTITGTGTTNITYQWQFSPIGPPAFTDIVNGATYSGTTTAILSVNTTGGFGQGRYRCRINGDLAAEVTTLDAALSISLPPPAPGTSGASVCGSGTVILGATGTTDGNYRWYTVSTGGSAIAGAVNGSYTTPLITSTTTYHVAINDGTCESSRTPVTAIITTITKPVVTTSNCTATGATLTGPTGFASYAWSDGSTTPSINVTLPGSYTLIVTSAAGCLSPSSDPTTFTSAFCNQAPTISPATVTTTIQAVVTLSLNTLINDLDNNIDPASIIVAVPPTSGAIATINAGLELVMDYSSVAFAGTDQLTIEACDLSGACAQQVIMIEVAGDITVYNALSPNGDGKNDVFYIQYIDALPETQQNKVTILNRWGSVVFETTNYDNTSNVFKGLSDSGAELPTGTYYYVVEFTSGASKQTGFISLRR